MSKIEDTLAQRGSTYGDFREQGRVVQNLKRAMQDSPNWWALPAYIREGLDTIQVKISRILNGNPLYDDNYHDIVGYAKLMEDRAAQDTKNGVVFKGGGDPMYPTYQHEDGPCGVYDGVAASPEHGEADAATKVANTVKRVMTVLNNAKSGNTDISKVWTADLETLLESPTRNAAIIIRTQRDHVDKIRRIIDLTGTSDAVKIGLIKNLMGAV